MYFRNKKKSAQDVYINDPLDSDSDENSLTLMDTMADENSIFDDIELRIKSEQLHRYMIDHLSGREQEILVMRYGLAGNRSFTQREVAEKLNISRSYVSRIEKKALEKLKKRFDAGDVARPPVKRSP